MPRPARPDTLAPHAGHRHLTAFTGSLGSTTDKKRYCARFTLPDANTDLVYKSTTAPAPAGCSPSGAFLAEDGSVL